VGGLQFLHDSTWIDVPVVENGLIINAGDYLRIVSQNRYISPIHRVLCPSPGLIRNSFVFFFYPEYDSLLPHINNSTVNSDYNTLLSTISLPNKIEKFGDYVIEKWKGVLKIK
jgi:isopenicillin N synthase-like dioxygenase